MTRNRTKFRERVSRVPASRHRSFRAGKCILANMTSFSGTELSLRKQIGVGGVRAASSSIIFFSILFRRGITDVRSTVISVCTALFMTRSVAADCTTLAHAEEEEEREKEGKRERKREIVSLSLFNADNKDVTSSA